ncbi:MAG TPA: TIGR01777 family oxidoreductase [Saprospiraceae bacterium]|nr:TIGR01777 family oxidoreductase [Saprospiraceae bacterium]HNG90722.1 TIGR01777 family oxidoreductase [Saprospiraceae bacterium]
MTYTVLLAGGTGFVGSRLAHRLQQEGHTVRILTRYPRSSQHVGWNPAFGAIDDQAVHSADIIINLAGAGIADARWTPARKRELVDSRVQSAATLLDSLRRTGHRPKAYLSASAIGYYGNSGERLMHETDSPLDFSFMVNCCEAWEAAALQVQALGIRTVLLRIGVVLAREGGALAELVKPLRFGLGAYFADGQAWYSWIHRDDLCRMFLWAMHQDGVSGIYNAVAPHPVRNKALVRAAAGAMRRPAALLVPVPAFVLRLTLGEMSAVVLNSNRVSAERVLAAGFEFSYPQAESALEEVLASVP